MMIKQTENTLKDVQENFDNSADMWKGLYVNFSKVNHKLLNDRTNYALEYLTQYLPGRGLLLDAGCGTGVACERAIKLGFSAHGVDISPKMIEHCRDAIKSPTGENLRAEFFVGDLEIDEIKEKSYDGILALGFLEYQPDEVAALKKLRSLLKDGGILLVTGPNKIKLSNYFGLGRIFEKTIKSKNAYVSKHHYTLAKFQNLLQKAGFDMVASKRHGYAGFYGLNLLMGYQAGLAIHNTLTWLAKYIPINALCDDIIVVAHKPKGA